MQREVEAFAFDFALHPQADRPVDQLEDDERDDDVVDEHDGDAFDLVDDLAGMSVDQSARYAAELLDREHAGQDGADGAADSMDAKGVERVIVAEHVLEAGAAPVADDAGRNADGDRADRVDEA